MIFIECRPYVNVYIHVLNAIQLIKFEGSRIINPERSSAIEPKVSPALAGC